MSESGMGVQREGVRHKVVGDSGMGVQGAAVRHRGVSDSGIGYRERQYATDE